jgi:predicted NBD/HSP70 family sugar kinase
VSDTAHSLAVDLGGTNTRVALVAPDGTVRARDEEPTARKDQHPDELIEHIRRVADGHEVDVAVAGVPGRVDHRSGRLEFAPNLPPTWAASLTEGSPSRPACGSPWRTTRTSPPLASTASAQDGASTTWCT